MTLDYAIYDAEVYTESVLFESSGNSATLTDKISSIINAFKEWVGSLYKKLTEFVKKSVTYKDVEDAKKNAKAINDANPSVKVTISDHDGYYKLVDDTHSRLKNIKKRLNAGDAVSKDEIDELMNVYHKRKKKLLVATSAVSLAAAVALSVDCGLVTLKGLTQQAMVDQVLQSTPNNHPQKQWFKMNADEEINKTKFRASMAGIASTALTSASVALFKEFWKTKAKDTAESVKFIKQLNRSGETVNNIALANLA